jgi:NhaA family Na+:H+ antiporter
MRHPTAVRAHHHPVIGRRSPIAPAVRFIVDRYLLLPIGAGTALVWANVAPVSYFTFSHQLSFFVNEIGMAFFLALMTQEVVEATMPGGALHSWRSRGMAIVAAAGGILGAVITYVAFIRLKYEYALLPGWPIAAAVDAVATYYVLKAIMPRAGVLPFALLLVIVTDLVGMMVVAPNYLALETRAGAVALLLVALGLAATLRTLKVRAFWPYLFVCGPIAWLAFYWGGVHPAFSLVPIVPFLPHEPRPLNLFADPPDDDAIHHAEHEWNDRVQLVVFLFGLVNAGVVAHAYGNGTWAMLAAALVGRPAGILAAAGLGRLAGLRLPRRIGWRELLVIALATSSGFTIGLFFATGMLAPGPIQAQLKLGVLISASGALLALGAAWAFRIGRFTSR